MNKMKKDREETLRIGILSALGKKERINWNPPSKNKKRAKRGGRKIISIDADLLPLKCKKKISRTGAEMGQVLVYKDGYCIHLRSGKAIVTNIFK